MIETVEVDESGDFNEDGSYVMPGLQGISGSEVKVAFMDPSGSMTGHLFPTGNPCDYLTVAPTEAWEENLSVRVTLLDVANPFVVVDATTLPPSLQGRTLDGPAYLSFVESIRREGAVLMGLADSTIAAAKVRGTPKIAFVWPASPDGTADITIRAFSMGKPHPSLQLTGAVCLGAGVCLPGTVPHRQVSVAASKSQSLPTPARTPSPGSPGEKMQAEEVRAQALSHDATQVVRLEHSSGLMEVEVVTRHFPGNVAQKVDVERCVVSRTARRLFEGKVFFYL